jgi:hypothetical protein
VGTPTSPGSNYLRLGQTSGDLTLSKGKFIGNGLGLTNLSGSYNLTTQYVQTNSGNLSNITVDVSGSTAEVTLWATNSLTLTNWTCPGSGIVTYKCLRIKPQLVNRSLAWPTLGTASYGVYIHTNSSGTSFFPTTLTNGAVYRMDISAEGTNLTINVTDLR